MVAVVGGDVPAGRKKKRADESGEDPAGQDDEADEDADEEARPDSRKGDETQWMAARRQAEMSMQLSRKTLTSGSSKSQAVEPWKPESAAGGNDEKEPLKKTTMATKTSLLLQHRRLTL